MSKPDFYTRWAGACIGLAIAFIAITAALARCMAG